MVAWIPDTIRQEFADRSGWSGVLVMREMRLRARKSMPEHIGIGDPRRHQGSLGAVSAERDGHP